MKIIAMPYAQEVSDEPMDTGSEIAVLQKHFGDQVDFSECFDGWNKNEGIMATGPNALQARAARVRKWLRARPEKEIVLVAHGNFNHFLTGDVDDQGNQTTGYWQHAELRTYRFAEDSPEDVAAIVESKDEADSRIVPQLIRTRDGALKN